MRLMTVKWPQGGRVVILVGMRIATQTLVTIMTKVQGSVTHGKT